MPTDKVYRPYHPHQDLPLPPSLQEWLPHDHGAHFVSDLVEHLDLSASGQVLAQQAGLLTLGHVALDDTQIRANASKHKAMSYARLCQEEPRLAAEVAAPLRRRENRVQKIREAKAAPEAQAHAQAER
jgi:hypothetical protein